MFVHETVNRLKLIKLKEVYVCCQHSFSFLQYLLNAKKKKKNLDSSISINKEFHCNAYNASHRSTRSPERGDCRESTSIAIHLFIEVREVKFQQKKNQSYPHVLKRRHVKKFGKHQQLNLNKIKKAEKSQFQMLNKNTT